MLIIGQAARPNITLCKCVLSSWIWDFSFCDVGIFPQSTFILMHFILKQIDALKHLWNISSWLLTGLDYRQVNNGACSCITWLYRHGQNKHRLNWKEERWCDEAWVWEDHELAWLGWEEEREGSVSGCGWGATCQGVERCNWAMLAQWVRAMGLLLSRLSSRFVRTVSFNSHNLFYPYFWKPFLYHLKWRCATQFDLQRNQPLLYACLAGLLKEQAQPYLLMLYLRKIFPSPTLLSTDGAVD